MVRKSCPLHGVGVNSARYGMGLPPRHCNCNQTVNLEHKLEFISEFKVFRIMGWDYRSMDWSEKPGTMNNGIAAYSHLRSIQEAYAQSKGSSGDRAAETIRNTPFDLPAEVFGVDEDKVREVFGVDEGKIRFGADLAKTLQENLEAIIAVRNGKAIGYVMPGLNGGVELIETVFNPFDLPAAPIRDQGWSVWSDTGIKTDGTEPQGKEWREYDPHAAWRLSPDVDRVEEISQFFGTQITIKWLNGYEKYGTKFKGDPVEHAFLEARDHMVYLWYIREERRELNETIDRLLRENEDLKQQIRRNGYRR